MLSSALRHTRIINMEAQLDTIYARRDGIVSTSSYLQIVGTLRKESLVEKDSLT